MEFCGCCLETLLGALEQQTKDGSHRWFWSKVRSPVRDTTRAKTHPDGSTSKNPAFEGRRPWDYHERRVFMVDPAGSAARPSPTVQPATDDHRAA